MPNKRKDNKGRLLRTGESQRKDLTYMYRYTDMRGKRQCVYADDLNKLREKEKKIQLDTLQGLDISGGGITVLELVERYVGLRRNVRYNTTVGYNFVLDCQHFFRQIFLGYFSDIVQAFDTLRKNVCGDDYTSLHNPIVLSSVLPAYGMFHSIQILFL